MNTQELRIIVLGKKQMSRKRAILMHDPTIKLITRMHGKSRDESMNCSTTLSYHNLIKLNKVVSQFHLGLRNEFYH
jgi:hypothetical protein